MTSLDIQIEQMEAMALQHYPQDTLLQTAYLVVLLKQRLREYDARLMALPVRSMPLDCPEV
jgi:hypothetical protein